MTPGLVALVKELGQASTAPLIKARGRVIRPFAGPLIVNEQDRPQAEAICLQAHRLQHRGPERKAPAERLARGKGGGYES